MVESRSQDAAVNAGVFSVYLTTILCTDSQLFFDIEIEKIRCSIYLCFNDSLYNMRLNCQCKKIILLATKLLYNQVRCTTLSF